jgi:hypothetical protein
VTLDLNEPDGDSVEFYPAWRQALVHFKEAGFTHGDLMPHNWFYEAFGIEIPNEQMPAGKYQKLKLQWLGQFKPFQNALLEQYQMDLVSEPGLGYLIIPPAEQGKRAYGDGLGEIKKAIRRMTDRMANTNLALIDAEQRKEHADMLARAGMLRGMLRQTRELPSPDDG